MAVVAIVAVVVGGLVSVVADPDDVVNNSVVVAIVAVVVDVDVTVVGLVAVVATAVDRVLGGKN